MVDFGWSIDLFVPGFARTLFDFLIGIFLFRLPVSSNNRKPVAQAVMIIALIAVLAGPYVSFSISLLSIIALFPMFIKFAQSWNVPEWLCTPCKALGRLSYPVYLLHTPVLLWMAVLYKLVAKRDPFVAGLPWLGWSMVLTTLLSSYVVARWIDEPLRAYLYGRIRGRMRAARATQS